MTSLPPIAAPTSSFSLINTPPRTNPSSIDYQPQVQYLKDNFALPTQPTTRKHNFLFTIGLTQVFPSFEFIINKGRSRPPPYIKVLKARTTFLWSLGSEVESGAYYTDQRVPT